ncbi:hypothetical protein M0R45_005233 [Rubus argutus]|uniref:ATPase AAA-type core domain-containing protein n=1 Tax=Rubus argutus TaxID=59490 RepID=A0AAW1YM04_RUBAR
MQGDGILDVYKITIVPDGESLGMLESVAKNEDMESYLKNAFYLLVNLGQARQCSVELLQEQLVCLSSQPVEASLMSPHSLIRNWGVFKVNFLFKAARQKSPCIIFIDEIDVIPGSFIRDDTHPMFQLKAQLRKLTQNDGILVIGVTNSIELLKGDLMSFFDLHIYFMNPDVEGRKEILE